MNKVSVRWCREWWQ